MLNKTLMLVSLIFLLPIVFTAVSEGANYPSRPIEIVAPSGAGGGWAKSKPAAKKPVPAGAKIAQA